MHSDLSPHLHSPECNLLIEMLHKCHQEHSIKRFLGYCNEIDTKLVKCLKKEREGKRLANYEKSRAKQVMNKKHVSD